MTHKQAVKRGRKGGKAGTGFHKVRGDSEYYRLLVQKREEKKALTKRARE